MNGATADPSVRTSNVPSINNTRIMGKSQNFFRSRMNAHSSSKNLLISDSFHPLHVAPLACHGHRNRLKLPLEPAGGKFFRLAQMPVRRPGQPPGRVDRRFAKNAEDDGDRYDNDNEHSRENNPRIDQAKHCRKPHPSFLDGRQP